MIGLSYTPEALADLERLIAFLLEAEADAAERAARDIVRAIDLLRVHPYIGRRVRRDVRELVISFGRAGYVALYRLTPSGVQILRIRHQREAGFT